ncbi:hypothetical protein [Sinomicrobium soli]|uniref:hypothetical protein n=1 Tax=Sinomicrobium sp. N-1-3-6 TaxID=2219864 RepID=UPI0011BE8E32|nr:hypothetical protein [Sinomicrobium sp. N-1-3-6]
MMLLELLGARVEILPSGLDDNFGLPTSCHDCLPGSRSDKYHFRFIAPGIFLVLNNRSVPGDMVTP